MSILGDVIWWRHQNDVVIDIIEVLLRHILFARPQIGLITQLRITKTQKIEYIQYFYKSSFFTS